MLHLPAQATLAQASALVQEVEGALAALANAPGAALQIDASGLTQFDSSLVATLLHARRLAQAAGRACEVLGAPAKLVRLAQLYGVEGLLPLAPARS